MATLTVSRRADLTDAQWAVPEPLLPSGRKPGRPPKWTKLQLIDGIRWRVLAGAPWWGRAVGVRAVADGVWAIPPLAAGRDLAADPDRAACQGRGPYARPSCGSPRTSRTARPRKSASLFLHLSAIAIFLKAMSGTMGTQGASQTRSTI